LKVAPLNIINEDIVFSLQKSKIAGAKALKEILLDAAR